MDACVATEFDVESQTESSEKSQCLWQDVEDDRSEIDCDKTDTYFLLEFTDVSEEEEEVCLDECCGLVADL